MFPRQERSALTPPTAPDPAPTRGPRPGLALAMILGVVAVPGCSGPPPPASIATDPVLVRGFAIYSDRCVSCHGATGRGDGPIAGNLAGPTMRDLVADEWRHGAAPAQVVAVLTAGVKDSAMPAYGGTYGRADLRATAAYVYHLAGRPVPAELRVP